MITFSQELCGPVILRNHFFSGVWQVELAENLRGETHVLFLKGEVVSFPVYRNATGCLPALFLGGGGGGRGLAYSTDISLYFFNKKSRGSLCPTVPSDRANRKEKEKKKQK